MKIENLDSINYEVVKKICIRSEVGLKTYGTTMDREDLGMLNWLQHLQEEMLDACVYIEKVMRTIEDRSPPENPPQ
jgi:hypothetical protein